MLLAGFGSAVFAIVTEYRRMRLSDETLAGVGLHDDMEHITRGYPEALRALVAAVELKDKHSPRTLWDALISDRAYRPAWSPQRALDHIVAGAGTQFDPDCVDAFLDVLARQGLSPTGEHSPAETAAAAANDCHVPVGTARPNAA